MARCLEWNSEYNTGNLMVDREHYELVELTNLLLIADDNADGGTVMAEALDALHRYVDQHFKNEEDLLSAVSSPHLTCQRLQHNALRQELNCFWVPGRTAPSQETVHELVTWVENRLVSHFKINDFAAFHDFPFADHQMADGDGLSPLEQQT